MFFLNNLRNTYHSILVIFFTIPYFPSIKWCLFHMRFTLLTFQGEVSDVFCIRERKNLRTSIISAFFSPYGLSPPQNTLVSFHRSRSPEHYGTTCRMIVRRKKKIERKFLSQTWVIILKHHNFNYFPLSFKKVLKKSVKTFVRFSHFPRYRNPLPENTRHGE